MLTRRTCNKDKCAVLFEHVFDVAVGSYLDWADSDHRPLSVELHVLFCDLGAVV